MNEFICIWVIAIVVVIFAVGTVVIKRFGPSIKNYIKSFINWNKNR